MAIFFDAPVDPVDLTEFTRRVPTPENLTLSGMFPATVRDSTKVDFREITKTNRTARFLGHRVESPAHFRRQARGLGIRCRGVVEIHGAPDARSRWSWPAPEPSSTPPGAAVARVERPRSGDRRRSRTPSTA